MCRPFAEKYAADQDLFFKDYVAAHLKLSELGVKWEEVRVRLVQDPASRSCVDPANGSFKTRHVLWSRACLCAHFLQVVAPAALASFCLVTRAWCFAGAVYI